jgi:cytochrome c-type biogenesis protein CcmI
VIFASICFAVLVTVALGFISWPLLQRREIALGASIRRGEALRRQKREALLLLRDLEFDRQTGKILEADYDALRAEAEEDALALLRRVDSLEEQADGGQVIPLPARPEPRPATLTAEADDAVR